MKSMGDSLSVEGSQRPRLVNPYALVTYATGPLGEFLNGLRRDLVSGCHLKSHVTFLPPRELEAPEPALWQAVQTVCDSWQPFDLELTGVEVFPGTQVIYLALGNGRERVMGLHRELNQGTLFFDEPFPYHPHVTLAQGLCGALEVEAARRCAEERWAAYRGPRHMEIDEVVFVREREANCWSDLAQLSLSVPVAVRG